jgi:hypothetical protein
VRSGSARRPRIARVSIEHELGVQALEPKAAHPGPRHVGGGAPVAPLFEIATVIVATAVENGESGDSARRAA